MIITIDNITKIIENGNKAGYAVTVKDIAYLSLLKVFSDKGMAYASLYGKDFSSEELESYDKEAKLEYVRKWMVKAEMESDISFEELKAFMVQLKNETEEAMRKKQIPKKDGLKILADISVKLNDKFSVTEKVDDQRIIVNSKYNDICPYCNHEIRVKTDEDMMEEIKKKYKLIPINNERENEGND